MSALTEYFHKKYYPDLPIDVVHDSIHGSEDNFNAAVNYVQQKHYSDIPPEKFENVKTDLKSFLGGVFGLNKMIPNSQNIQEISPRQLSTLPVNAEMSDLNLPGFKMPAKKLDLSYFKGSTPSEAGDYKLFKAYEADYTDNPTETDPDFYRNSYKDSLLVSEEGDSPYRKMLVDFNNYRVNNEYKDLLRLSKDNIKLTQGRYNLGKINTAVIDEVRKVSKQYGVDPMDVLAVMGRETTFGNVYNPGKTDTPKGQDPSVISGLNQQKEVIDIASLLNVEGGLDKNKFMTNERFLADRGNKNVKVIKGKYGYDYRTVDQEKLDKSVSEKDYKDYSKLLKDTPYDGALSYIAKLVRDKKQHKINPGDPDYVNKLKAEKELLLKEPNLMKYLSK